MGDSMSLKASDLPEQVRDALDRGEEALLFVTGAASILTDSPETTGIEAYTDVGWPEKSSPAALALAQALQKGVKEPTRYYLKGPTAARITEAHRRHEDPRMLIYTIEITGKLNAEGNLAARAELTVHETWYGIGAVQVAASRAHRHCRETLDKEGMAWS
jgi:hypothetical protein